MSGPAHRLHITSVPHPLDSRPESQWTAWEEGRIAGYNQGRDNERTWWRSRLVSDETVEAAIRVLNTTMHLTARERATAVLAVLLLDSETSA